MGEMTALFKKCKNIFWKKGDICITLNNKDKLKYIFGSDIKIQMPITGMIQVICDILVSN